MRIGMLMTATALAVASFGFSASDAEAQSRTLRNTSGPAEQPPADFAGRQYVDSQGCVFMRTGRGGQTTWVPRVSRNRQVVCGQSPSLSGGSGTAVATVAPTPATTPAPAAAPAQVAVSAPTPSRAPVVRQGTASAAAAAAASTRATPRRVVVSEMPSAGQQMRRVTQSGGVQIAAAPVAIAGGHGCGASALSAAYLPGCGRGHGQVASVAPVQVQQIRTTSYGVTGAAPTRQVQVAPAGIAAPAGVVVSGHGCGASALSQQYLRGATHCGGGAGYNVYGTQNPVHAGQRIPSVVGVAPPAGYRPAFTDGRLNPNRGLVTHSGAVQSQQIWTRTVPRQLVPSYHGGRQVIIVTR